MALHYSAHDLDKLERNTRIHLFNSISGIKSANLVGTVSDQGIENLAIFSSVIHLGSHPPLLGFIVRPQRRSPRDTYSNIIKTGYFTINAILTNMVDRAHNTSIHFEPDVNEFDQCNFKACYLDDFIAPYVTESAIKVGLKLSNHITIPENNAELMIGHIQALHIELDQLPVDGQLNLDELDITGISGLNSYYSIHRKCIKSSAHRK